MGTFLNYDYIFELFLKKDYSENISAKLIISVAGAILTGVR